jgi:hypothetical protein
MLNYFKLEAENVGSVLEFPSHKNALLNFSIKCTAYAVLVATGATGRHPSAVMFES